MLHSERIFLSRARFKSNVLPNLYNDLSRHGMLGVRCIGETGPVTPVYLTHPFSDGQEAGLFGVYYLGLSPYAM